MIAWPVLCAAAALQGTPSEIYFVRNDSIYKSAGGREQLIVKHAVGPALAADGKHMAFIRDGDLYVYDLEKSETKRCSHLSEKPTNIPDHDPFPSWDARSKFVIFSHPDRYTVTHRGEAIHSMFGTERTAKTIWNVYWGWTNKTTLKTRVSLFLGNETTGPSSFSVASTMSAAFSPDGKRVAFCRNGDLWMATIDPSSIHDSIREASWDEARVLACGTQEGGTRASNETTSIFRIAWSPDGKLLALSTDRYGASGSPEIVVVRADQPSEKVTSFAGREACFAGPGRVLYVKPYTTSQDIWLRDIETKDEKVVVSRATEPAVGK